MKDPTIAQLEAREFFAAPCKTTLRRVVTLALDGYEEWADRWELATIALQAIGLKYCEQELEVAFSERKDERDEA